MTEISGLEFLEALKDVRSKVEQILAACPGNRIEARRLFTRELEVDPTPEELRTIGEAAGRIAESDPLGDLSASVLATWALAVRDVRSVFDGVDLESEDLAAAARRIPDLLRLVRSVENEIASRMNRSSPDDRKFLSRLRKLTPATAPLIAAEVIAPRLDGSVGAGRVCKDAAALTAAIRDDLAAWEALPEGADDAARDELIGRLERDKTAYRYVSGRLQQEQDAALSADPKKISEQLRDAQRNLFSAYLALAPILKAAHPAPTGPEIDIAGLLEESAATDREAEARQAKKVSTHELCLNALEELRDGKKPAPVTPAARRLDRGREKLRLGILISIAASLVVACVFAYGGMLRTKPTSLRVTVSDLPDKLALTNAMTVGPMMYAQVSHHSWDHLTPQERISRVNELGLNLADRGIRTVYLTDEANVQVAIWSDSKGTTLPESDRKP